MSLASCSTRFESSPARTSDIGLQVDSARTVTSSPDATRSTGSPAASYQPHATVFGVGISVCDRPARGVLQSSACVGADAGAPLCKTEDGAWQPSASNPPTIAVTIFRMFVSPGLSHTALTVQ